jgi:capsular exopolysaccharide synthesis family protein
MGDTRTGNNATKPNAAAEANAPAWLRQEGAGFTLRRFHRMLRRRRLMILGCVLPITTVAVLFVYSVVPIYRAEARLVVETPRAQAASPQGAGGIERPDLAGNTTQAAIIASREIAAQAVDRLHLMESPLFNPETAKPPKGLVNDALAWIERLAVESGVRAWLDKQLGGLAGSQYVGDTSREPSIDRAALLHETVIGSFLQGLTVAPDERSRVISVRYESPDPAMAALAANTVSELYLAQLRAPDEGPDTRGPAQDVQALSERVAAAERRLDEFQRRAVTVPSGSAALYEQQAARIEDQLSQARIEVSEAKAKSDQAQQALNASGNDAAAIDNPLIQTLRQQESKLLSTLAELRTQYRDNHPKVKDALDELQDIRGKIRAALAHAGQNLRNQYELARLREQRLVEEQARLQSVIQAQRETSLERAALEAEVKSSQERYAAAAARLKEAGAVPPKPPSMIARMISRAPIPTSPVFPETGPIIAAAIIGSLALGLALASIAENLESGFRTRSDLERGTGLAVHGLIPYIPRAATRRAVPHARALAEPNSTYGEAIRALRTALLHARGDARPRVIMVTSASPGEGKTSTAAALATTAARAGERAIIVECDVLRPSLSRALGCSVGPGLGDFLAGRAAIDQVVRIDGASGAHYITVGDIATNGSDLLGSTALRNLIMALRESYELVVIDSPPVLAVSDALVLQRLVDETVFIVRWQRTPRDIVYAALRQMAEAGATFVSLALSHVDIRKHARYEYGRFGERYYRDYRSYHSDAA